METREVTITLGEVVTLNTELNGSELNQSLISETVDGKKKYLLVKISRQTESEAKDYNVIKDDYIKLHGKESNGTHSIEQFNSEGKMTAEYLKFVEYVNELLSQPVTINVPTELTLDDVLATNCKGNFKVIYSILEP